VAAIPMAVKGGAITISTPDVSFTLGMNSAMNSLVSGSVLFIFQFAAIKGLRIEILYWLDHLLSSNPQHFKKLWIISKITLVA
jgi:hypothetical protein